MKTVFKAATAVVALLALTGIAQAATLIDFDDVTGSEGYTSPTNVNTHYAAQGVTFSDPAYPEGGGVGVVKHLSSSNVLVGLADNKPPGNASGDLRIDFSVPVNTVTMDMAGFFDAAVVDASVYDTSGKFLETVSFAQQNIDHAPAVTGTIDTGSTDIGYLSLVAHSYRQPDNYEFLYIDDLSFGVSAVPEPATWTMALLGFLGLGCLSYRRKSRLGRAVA
jgi:hypothetical protein